MLRDHGRLEIEEGGQLGQESPCQLAQVGMAHPAIYCRDFDERPSRGDLERHRIGRSLELLDQGPDVAEGDFGGVEGLDPGGQVSADPSPQQFLADVQRDGIVLGDQCSSGEQRSGFVHRRPCAVVTERQERTVLRGESQRLRQAGISRCVPDIRHQRLDDSTGYPLMGRVGLLHVVDLERHACCPAFLHQGSRHRYPYPVSSSGGRLCFSPVGAPGPRDVHRPTIGL